MVKTNFPSKQKEKPSCVDYFLIFLLFFKGGNKIRHFSSARNVAFRCLSVYRIAENATFSDSSNYYMAIPSQGPLLTLQSSLAKSCLAGVCTLRQLPN